MTSQLTEAEINALKLKADKYERRLVYNNQKVKEYNAIFTLTFIYWSTVTILYQLDVRLLSIWYIVLLERGVARLPRWVGRGS